MEIIPADRAPFFFRLPNPHTGAPLDTPFALAAILAGDIWERLELL